MHFTTILFPFLALSTTVVVANSVQEPNHLVRIMEEFERSNVCIADTLAMQSDFFLAGGSNFWFDEEESESTDDILQDESLFNHRVKRNDRMVFNFNKSFFDQAHVCHEVGGSAIPLRFRTVHDSSTVVVKNLILCMASTCTDYDLEQFLIHVNSDEITVKVETGTLQCVENPASTFSIERDGVIKQRSCQWLQDKPSENRIDLCARKAHIRTACPVTCCMCTDERKKIFMKENANNERKMKRCGWLAKKSAKAMQKICADTSDLSGNELGLPALTQCPSTCGQCSV
ncbi:predicted protein [Chaetoceros tenuissimus]|uniref:ShKT domain-containing protein n=1 Tax=Chaetoceros tenuissimus TaxID=426638 RepID=A0AAD3H685_9STRA|nr:predicted protein [Chaetoceros tenuissimus]